jgi:hypothetical protein
MRRTGFGAWRAAALDPTQHVDLLRLAEHSIEADLARRDRTINTTAQARRAVTTSIRSAGWGPASGTAADAVGQAFVEDPLRTLRIAGSRPSCPSPSIPESAMAARAGSVVLDWTAPERIFAELKRVVIADRTPDGLALIDTLGGTDAVLSERSDLRGVEHRHYHPPRRAEHTRAVSQRRSSSTPEPERCLREHADAVAELLSESLANELTAGSRVGSGRWSTTSPATDRHRGRPGHILRRRKDRRSQASAGPVSPATGMLRVALRLRRAPRTGGARRLGGE